MRIPVKTENGGYDIVLKRGAVERAGEYFNLNRKVMIVTDDGVPHRYAEIVADACPRAEILVVPRGEQSKNFDNLKNILHSLVKYGFTRSDCVVAVGGGVVGDMAGLAAALFMRGIDFYNIPTTLLAQVDSSIGGKTAIDFDNCKNIVGAFHQPRGVIIDPDVLQTLPRRQISNGLAEVIKMALTHDAQLFEMLENEDVMDNIETVIERSLRIKRDVVERDEREEGLRRVLNFGHTVGHAIESLSPGLYHGECVALGMVPMCSPGLKQRLLPVLKKFDLPAENSISADALIEIMRHDKKIEGDKISLVTVETPGIFKIEKLEFSVFANKIKEVCEK